jgi:hypothetical protein
MATRPASEPRDAGPSLLKSPTSATSVIFRALAEGIVAGEVP